MAFFLSLWVSKGHNTERAEVLTTMLIKIIVFLRSCKIISGFSFDITSESRYYH